MKKNKKNLRIGVMSSLFVLIITVYCVVLIKAVVVDNNTGNSVSKYDVVVEGARGEILDRNGVTLVYNRQGNSIKFNAALFPSQSKNSERNEIIYTLIELCESKNEEWIDNLPIIYNEFGELVFEEERETDIKGLKSSNMLNLNSYATAQNCLDALTDMYDLHNYDEATARKIASVRYEMWRTGYSITNPYTFAEDVSNETVSIIKEKSEFFRGVDVEIAAYREYSDSALSPHVIGVTGVINSDEYNKYNDSLSEKLESTDYTDEEKTELKRNSYSVTDYIGKFGIELAMEDYLKGTKGVKTISIDSQSNVQSEYTVNPEQGNTVVLTMESGLQKVAQNSLERRIQELRAMSSSELDAAGAVVVVDVDTGEVLASASYPTYDLAEYFEKYDELLEADGNPLVNRALQSTYEPGSTMKISTAVAGLEEKAINTQSTYYCNSIFEYFDVTFGCLHSHGYLDVIHALEKSCNIFFYNVSESLGIDVMNSYSSKLGLGQKTGVEIAESKGILAGRSYRESIGSSWQMGDTIQAGIGQSDNLFTIIQLANYCATIANNGTRYKCHFVKYIMSADHSEIIYEAQPEIVEKTGFSQASVDIVKQGMLAVTTTGSCTAAFSKIPEKVGAKTGTTQVKRVIDGRVVEGNNGLNISFAPFDKPEIAVAVIIENVDSGTATATVAADIYEYYFSTKNQVSSSQSTNQLLR